MIEFLYLLTIFNVYNAPNTVAIYFWGVVCVAVCDSIERIEFLFRVNLKSFKKKGLPPVYRTQVQTLLLLPMCVRCVYL